MFHKLVLINPITFNCLKLTNWDSVGNLHYNSSRIRVRGDEGNKEDKAL